MMKTILKDPAVGQKVILTNSLGEESKQRIVDVTPKSIRVSSCNLYRFNRNGALNASISLDGVNKITIRPE